MARAAHTPSEKHELYIQVTASQVVPDVVMMTMILVPFLLLLITFYLLLYCYFIISGARSLH